MSVKVKKKCIVLCFRVPTTGMGVVVIVVVVAFHRDLG